jgi:hypothetical protein
LPKSLFERPPLRSVGVGLLASVPPSRMVGAWDGTSNRSHH